MKTLEREESEKYGCVASTAARFLISTSLWSHKRALLPSRREFFNFRVDLIRKLIIVNQDAAK